MSSDSPSSPTGQSATRTSQAWSSGRVLSVAQRERKRTTDRINKSRQRREQSKTIDELKAQIEHLSAKVLTLEQRQHSAGVPQIVSGSSAVTSLPRPNTTPSALSFAAGLPRAPGRGLDLQYSTHSGVPLPEVDSHAANSALMDFRNRDSDGLIQVAALPSEGVMLGNSVAGVRPVVVQDLFSELVRRGCISDRKLVCSDQATNDDMLIRGVTLGWHTINLLCPLWKITSLLDQYIFGHSSVITRFCTLRTTLFALLYMTGSISARQLPAWLRPRPTQARFKHDEAIDMLPWSGLRERAILCQDMTRSNQFWREVIHLFEFNWPYATEMPYEFDPSSNMYRFTGAFENRVRDIRCWNMHPQFFKTFPDAFDDIVPASFVSPLYTQLDFSTVVLGTWAADADVDDHPASTASTDELEQIIGCHGPSSSRSGAITAGEAIDTSLVAEIDFDSHWLQAPDMSLTFDTASRQFHSSPRRRMVAADQADQCPDWN